MRSPTKTPSRIRHTRGTDATGIRPDPGRRRRRHAGGGRARRDRPLHRPRAQDRARRGHRGGKSRIVVDLEETTFLDSTALGVLIGTVKRLRSRDGRLTIVNVDQNIAKTFEITGLDQIFTIRATRDEALAALDEEEAPAS